jgi:hypothetical protein
MRELGMIKKNGLSKLRTGPLRQAQGMLRMSKLQVFANFPVDPEFSRDDGHGRTGFTIIEALVSFFITILLVSLVFQFSAKFYSSLLERSKFNSIYLENYSALDHIVRNVSQASCNKVDWKKISTDQIIWHDSENKIDMGYIMQDQNLYFITGSYMGDSWSNNRRNLLSACTKEIKFSKNIRVGGFEGDSNQGFISSIACTIVFNMKNRSYELKRVIGLKNGAFY